MPNILNRNGVSFINLKSNYLVSLRNTYDRFRYAYKNEVKNARRP